MSSRRTPSRVVFLAALGLALAGCAREAPDVREVRRATTGFLAALRKGDVKAIADRSTCLVSTNSFAGGRILAIEASRWIRSGDLDSLVRSGMAEQRRADSTWSRARDTDADSLFRLARLASLRSSVYRNAIRAASLSAPGKIVPRDSTLELRTVRARFRYAGPVIGPAAVNREQTLHLLRAPGGAWIVFSVYLRDEDPTPDLGRPERV